MMFRMMRLTWTDGNQRGPPQKGKAIGREETLAQFRMEDV